MALARIDWAKAYPTWGLTRASVERPYSPSRLLDVLRRFLPRGEGATVLELGCAPGRWLRWAETTLGIRPLGVDLDPEGVRLTHSLWPALDLVRADAVHLPFPDAAVDAVYALGVIEHLEDPGPLLAEARRVTKPGGISVWSVPNLAPGSLCRWHWRTFHPESYAAHRVFTLAELGGVIGRQGFAVVHEDYSGLYIPHCQHLMGRLPLRRALKKLEGPVFATSLVVVARNDGSGR